MKYWSFDLSSISNPEINRWVVDHGRDVGVHTVLLDFDRVDKGNGDWTIEGIYRHSLTTSCEHKALLIKLTLTEFIRNERVYFLP